MFASFDPDVRATNRFLERALVTEKGELALKVWQKAVDISPVFSGRYRDSWQISVGELSFRFNNSSQAANSIPKPTKPSITVAGTAMDKIFVSNGAPYSYLVEYGGILNRAHHVAYRAVSASV